MKALKERTSYGSAAVSLYAADMATTELMSIEDARAVLGKRFDRARDADVHTVVTKHGEPEGVLVDFAWYRKAREALGEPTEIQVTPKSDRPRRRRATTRPPNGEPGE